MHSPLSEDIARIDSAHHYYHYQGSLFHTGRGDYYRLNGQAELARADYKKALFLDHYNDAAHQGLRRLEDAVEADIAYDTALRTMDILSTIAEPAMALYQQGDYDQAITLNAQAHEAYHIAASDIHMARGEWYEAQGEWDLAMNDYLKAIDIHNGNDAAKIKRDLLSQKKTALP